MPRLEFTSKYPVLLFQFYKWVHMLYHHHQCASSLVQTFKIQTTNHVLIVVTSCAQISMHF
uniref:Uncharacterized protein n=1 Tax=Arundo donax TaxID=35708 RepID=A0A0A8YRK8_ARUDO